jgi:catechol 2,3-dioxygenase-like lactoylglutathione lyase family enzyme
MMLKFLSFFLLLQLVFNFCVDAQETFSVTFNHQALSVKDVDKAAEFYKTVVQLPEITNRTKMDGIRWFSLGDGKELHLISIIKDPVQINKAVHLALTTTSMEALVRQLEKNKVAYGDFYGKPNTVTLRADGVQQLYFQDPDGYWIEVNDAGTTPEAIDAIKNEVWQKEEDYWVYIKKRDLASYRTLWDDQFIGYPSTNVIGNKAHITDWIDEMYQNKKDLTFNYELTRKVENVFGDIVIVLYDASQLWTNSKGEITEKKTFKLTHTWKKTDKDWVIIGGMGAVK